MTNDKTKRDRKMDLSRRRALAAVGAGIAGVAGFSGTASASDFAGGNGTESSPYQIETWEHLDNIAFSEDHYVLNNDLDENTEGYAEYAAPDANGGEGWSPIGGFDGVLDGNGNTVADFSIVRTGLGDDVIGLFSDLIGEIRNLNLNAAGVVGNNQVGTLAGDSRGEIINCSALSAVDAVGTPDGFGGRFPANLAGGLVGRNRGIKRTPTHLVP